MVRLALLVYVPGLAHTGRLMIAKRLVAKIRNRSELDPYQVQTTSHSRLVDF